MGIHGDRARRLRRRRVDAGAAARHGHACGVRSIRWRPETWQRRTAADRGRLASRHGERVRRARPGARARSGRAATSSTSRSASRTSRHPSTSPWPASRQSARATRTTARRPVCPSSATRPRRISATTRRMDVSPGSVLVGNGAKPFLFYTVLATCGPGRRGRLSGSGLSRSTSRPFASSGATPVPLPLREERGFSFDPAELEALLSARTRLVILNAPQNPTGGRDSRSRPGRPPRRRSSRRRHGC